MTERKKLTEEECLAIGGHCWSEPFGINDIVDEFGNIDPNRKYLMVDHGKIFRMCKHCGKRQKFIPGEWQ